MPYYVQDLGTGTLRLPDLRGMYAEAAGFDSLGVGGTHIDMVRNIPGSFGGLGGTQNTASVVGAASGAFVRSDYQSAIQAPGQSGQSGAGYRGVSIDPSRVVPTGAANKPRAWGALACAYLGQPAA